MAHIIARRVWILPALFALLAGCEDDGASTNKDATPAVDVAAGDLSGADLQVDVGPAPDGALTVDGALTPASMPAPDGGPPADDAMVDNGGVVDPGPVQCRSDADCGGTLTCLMHIPGGHCKGCTNSAQCPGGLKCFQSICVRPCTTDADCNIGLRCLSGQHCAGKGCNATPGCPSIYPCNYSLCERPKCDQGQTCPAPLTCDGTYCVEP